MTRDGLKILIPALSFGRAGGIRVLSQLANHWSGLGQEVSFVVFFESEGPYYPVNVNVIWIDHKGNATEKNSTEFQQQNSGFKRLLALYRFLKRHSRDYDIVLANSNLSTWPIWLGSKSTNFYYIQAYEVEFHNVNSIKGLMKRFAAWITYYLPFHKVVNADLYKNYKNINCEHIIAPGLELKTYYPKDLWDNCHKELVVGCIGRNEEWKGAQDVGEAVKILHNKGLNVKLKVAFNPIKYANHELVIPDGDENLANFYRSLDVLVAPGHIQLGAVHYPVIEAMACNVPVITTGYYPANNDNSYIVPVKRPDIIADTLETIMSDYDSAIKKSNRANLCVQQFDWNVVSGKFIDLFRQKI